jgi:hypothetical protein
VCEELRVSRMLGKHSTTGLKPQHSFFSYTSVDYKLGTEEKTLTEKVKRNRNYRQREWFGAKFEIL